MRVTLIVLAKAPAPGRSKTRLCPPCSPHEAATLAAAALADTIEAVAGSPVAGSRVLALDGAPGPWVPDDWRVLPQRGRGLDERLANAFADAGRPALLVGMDTPQLTPGLVAAGARALARPGIGAVLGPALDGGYWAIGLREPDAAAFLGVPMSTGRTLAIQRARLRSLGLATADLPVLRDVDTIEDAHAVAAAAPRTRFAARLARTPGATRAADRTIAGRFEPAALSGGSR